MFFSLLPKLHGKQVFLCDKNELLIQAYLAVRDDVESLIEILRGYENTADLFYEIREWDRQDSYSGIDSVVKASRLIYLNKTCYNGLYRVNSKGHFNVPYGNYKRPTICDESNLRACSKALQDVDIRTSDYLATIDQIGSRAFVYIDPPYEPLSETSSFCSFTAESFDEVDQTRLFKFCQTLNRKRAYFLLSNSNTWVKYLYKKEKRFHLGWVLAKRSINSNKSGRGSIKEIVVRNYS